MKKLTPAQQKVFDEIMVRGEFYCVPEYKPAQALIKAGLARSVTGKYGSLIVMPTDAAYLFAEKQSHR